MRPVDTETELRSLLAVVPVRDDVRADPAAAGGRTWLLVAALVAALVEVSGLGPPATSDALVLRAGSYAHWLALAIPLAGEEHGDPVELCALVALSFEERVARIDRLRADIAAVPISLFERAGDLRAPIGDAHPLRVAEAVARLGGDPVDETSVALYEDAVLDLLADSSRVAPPHEDPDTDRRIARRILQRLAGMGKWGGYHTEFAHLARGFARHERDRALEVGEALVDAGLLREKPSVGQRHVFLDPRRAADIRALVEDGQLPRGLRLPE